MANKKRLFTFADLQKSKVAGINQEAFEQAKKPEKKKGGAFPKSPCLQVQYMWSQLAWWSLAKGIEVVREHKFDEVRRWRFDFAIIHLKIAIEYEGIYGGKSRHTTTTGYNGDIEKYNTATEQGWRVLRFTASTYKSILQEVYKLT